MNDACQGHQVFIGTQRLQNPMIKHILVGSSGLAFDADLLTAAFNLARPFSAHVDVLHVQRDPGWDLPIDG
jgi:hypothetical protein